LNAVDEPISPLNQVEEFNPIYEIPKRKRGRPKKDPEVKKREEAEKKLNEMKK
jgi:hypothetical protein